MEPINRVPSEITPPDQPLAMPTVLAQLVTVMATRRSTTSKSSIRLRLVFTYSLTPKNVILIKGNSEKASITAQGRNHQHGEDGSEPGVLLPAIPLSEDHILQLLHGYIENRLVYNDRMEA